MSVGECLALAVSLIGVLGCGSPGGGGASPTKANETPEGGGASTQQPPCLTRPSEVVALGDSYIAAPVVLIPKLVQLAISDGALMQGDSYRDYSVPGATVDTPQGGGSIPPQWTRAKLADSHIKFVIMDGGGNDILGSVTCIAAGSNNNAMCTGIVQRVTDVVTTMMDDMQMSGVTDVVYLMYPHPPVGGADIDDYAVSQAQDLCARKSTSTFRCHIVDPRMAFQGHSEYFGASDPIHPNATGSQVLAQLVWDAMKSDCIAQPASSGCCMP
jgi:lysophospholipase L1-like esterase